MLGVYQGPVSLNFVFTATKSLYNNGTEKHKHNSRFVAISSLDCKLSSTYMPLGGWGGGGGGCLQIT